MALDGIDAAPVAESPTWRVWLGRRRNKPSLNFPLQLSNAR
jgi:hypothetical protein